MAGPRGSMTLLQFLARCLSPQCPLSVSGAIGLRMFTCLLQRLTLDIVTEDIHHLPSIDTHSLGTFLKLIRLLFSLYIGKYHSTIAWFVVTTVDNINPHISTASFEASL